MVSQSNLDFSYTSNVGGLPPNPLAKGGGFFPNLRAKQRESNATYQGVPS